jgi:excisionase family DNA binding protein
MTTVEVAKELGVTKRMVNLMIEKGVLPAKRFGRANVVDRAALRRYMERRGKEIKP